MNDITITFRGMLVGYLRTQFIADNKIIGYINEEYEFPNNKMNITFINEDRLNQYCLILFIIATVNYWDSH
ncbi:hypothetical protein [Chryseobacterium polytrichastri]|nr:hypothetical protein [Chryseobacterium polytrichastri]